MKSVHKQMLGHIVAHEIYINIPAHPKKDRTKTHKKWSFCNIIKKLRIKSQHRLLVSSNKQKWWHISANKIQPS